VIAAGAVALAGCETRSEAIANPCPNASSKGSPQDPKIGLSPDELKAQDDCSTSTEATDKVCADIDALKDSVTDLKNVDVADNGTGGLRDALNTVKDDAEQLRAVASSGLRPAVDQLDSALSALRTSIENVVSGGTGPVNTAAQNARQSAVDLEIQARTLYNCV
jgi:hypothetical protein